jgi:hypothetical protein
MWNCFELMESDRHPLCYTTFVKIIKRLLSNFIALPK